MIGLFTLDTYFLFDDASTSISHNIEARWSKMETLDQDAYIYDAGVCDKDGTLSLSVPTSKITLENLVDIEELFLARSYCLLTSSIGVWDVKCMKIDKSYDSISLNMVIMQ